MNSDKNKDKYKDKYPEHDLTETIIGAAFRVSNSLGAGFLERVYENALVVELDRAGVPFKQQEPYEVNYEGACGSVYCRPCC